MRKVLADARFEFENFIHLGFHTGHSFFVLEIFKCKSGHFYGGGKWSGFRSDHILGKGHDFIMGIKIFQEHEVHIGKLFTNDRKVFPIGHRRVFRLPAD